MRSLKKIRLAAILATSIVAVALPEFTYAQQKFPGKPVRLVLGSGAGGPVDILARIIGPKLSEGWGQPVVIENRPGASGALGALQVAKAAPDGYSILLAPVGFVTNAVLQPNLPYDPIKDFAGVAQLGFPITVLIVAPSLGVKTVKEFIALGKAQAGKMLLGSAGAGSAAHLGGERVRLAAGFKIMHVGFKGQPEAMLEVLAGRVHYAVVTLSVALPLIKDGRILALGVTSPRRLAALPDVPALAETLPQFSRPEATGGLLAPAHTPRAILEQISKEAARVLSLPDVRERLQSIGYVIMPSTPDEHDKIRRAQIESLTKLVIEAGLRAK